MLLYLIRHADAAAAANDALRPLSPAGREQVRALAQFLRSSGTFSPAEVWHSPLVRARETAVDLVQHLGLAAQLVEARDLLPEDDPAGIAAQLGSRRQSLALVGHEPHLSGLASLLIAGSSDAILVTMQKCSVLALEGAGGHWGVRWHISPEIVR